MGVPWRVRLVLFLAALFILTLAELSARLLPHALPAALVGWALAAAAMAAGLLDRRLRRETSRWRAQHSLARRLSRQLEPDALLKAGLAHAAELAGADAACLRMLEADGTMALSCGLNLPPGYEETHRALVPRAKRGAPGAFPSETALLGPAALPPEIRDLLPKGQARAALIAPLVAEGSVSGQIVLAFRSRRTFAADEMEALRAMGAQIAGAAANTGVRDELLRQAQTDALTGVYSRRYFEDAVRRELSRARRSSQPLSIAMIDVDRFKQINDTCGHATGDEVLRRVARLVSQVRATDVAARIGGDEFVMIMPDTNLEQAEIVVRRLRERVRQLNERQEFPFALSLSIGVRQMTDLSLESLLAAADAAMYTEKRRKAGLV